jgi:hypothetical protein
MNLLSFTKLFNDYHKSHERFTLRKSDVAHFMGSLVKHEECEKNVWDRIERQERAKILSQKSHA